MLFWQFSNIIIYVKIVGKIPDQHLSIWLFSNPGDKVQILVESTGQICPRVLHLFRTLSPGFEYSHTFKCWSGIFPIILTYTIMFENCQNNISMYGCSPIHETKFYSCWNLNKLYFRWHVTPDMWHLTPDMWHVICDTCHVSHNTQGVINIV